MIPETTLPATGPDRLSDQVYRDIFDRIMQGEFPRGSRLPTQQRLSEIFGVSRPIVREALMRLSDDGLIRSRQGSGSFVQHQPGQEVLNFASIDRIPDINRCLEFRSMLEGEAALLAAQRRTAGDLAEIENAFARLRAVSDIPQPDTEADFLFHLAVARAAQNRYFERMMQMLREPATAVMHLTINLTGLRQERHEVLEEHEAVLIGIRDQRPFRARAAMRRHLQRARARVVSGA